MKNDLFSILPLTDWQLYLTEIFLSTCSPACSIHHHRTGLLGSWQTWWRSHCSEWVRDGRVMWTRREAPQLGVPSRPSYCCWLNLPQHQHPTTAPTTITNCAVSNLYTVFTVARFAEHWVYPGQIQMILNCFFLVTNYIMCLDRKSRRTSCTKNHDLSSFNLLLLMMIPFNWTINCSVTGCAGPVIRAGHW